MTCPTGVKDVVTIKGTFLAYDPKNPILGELAAEMLERGTEKHDAEAIATLLDKIGAKIDFASDSGTIKFEARCLKKDSAQVIDLLAEQLREPNFPKDEFEKLRKQKIAESQQLKDDPSAQAMIALRRAIFQPGHPQYRLTDDERIAALEKANVDDVKAFHKKYFGPEYCTMVVVGDIQPASIEKEVKSAFSGWKGGQPLPKLPPVKDITKPENLKVSIPGKESVIVLFGEPTGLHYADADYLPLSVATNVLGYGFTSRLLSTVRDTEGLTYGMQAQLTGPGKLDQTWGRLWLLRAVAVEARAGIHASRARKVVPRWNHGSRTRLSKRLAGRWSPREAINQRRFGRCNSRHGRTWARFELD